MTVKALVKISADVRTQKPVLRDSRDKWTRYEAGKREIGDGAQSAAEYEQRVNDLAKRLGV